MRMAFGLVSLLVTLGIIVLVMSMMLDKETGSVPAALKAREETKQITGVGRDGERATRSASFEQDTTGGKLRKLTVLDVIAGGAYDTYFGLRKGDEIVEIEMAGSMTKLQDITFGDAEMAEAQVYDAFRAKQHIIVNRDGQRLTLPLAPGTVVASPAGAAAPAPAAPGATPPADAPADDRSSLSRQLDAIKGAGN